MWLAGSRPPLRRDSLGGTQSCQRGKVSVGATTSVVRLSMMVTMICVGVPAAAAQTSGARHHLEVGGLVGLVTADGSDFSGTRDATGFVATARYVLFGHLGLGIGFHYSDHGLRGLPEHLQIRGLYGELRYTAHLRDSRVSVFAGIRGGAIHEDITVVSWTARGWAAGGVAGVTWPVLSPIAIEVQASEMTVHLGNRRLDDGSVVSGSSARGRTFGLQGGVVIWL